MNFLPQRAKGENNQGGEFPPCKINLAGGLALTCCGCHLWNLFDLHNIPPFHRD